ncbi:MAG: hypothetical protein RIQ33_214 [Bacteroidota bacterium]|jgi:hypothetical protein
MKEKEIQNIIFELGKRAKVKDRNCLFDGCPNLAIESHLLQENGILDSIKDNTNHLWEQKIEHFKNEFYFDKIGIRDAFTFKGFCNTHDNSIFKSIETQPIHFNNYKSQLLFSYRVLMNEKRKKEIIIDQYSRILNSFKLRLFLDEKYLNQLDKFQKQNELGLNDIGTYESIFLSNLADENKQDFQFITREISKIDLCISSVFTHETIKERIPLLKINPNYQSSDIYIHLFPLATTSIIIIGCLKERVYNCWSYIKEFETADNNKCLKKISDLIVLGRIENWICSKQFYLNNVKSRETQLFDTIRYSFSKTIDWIDAPFNLFGIE